MSITTLTKIKAFLNISGAGQDTLITDIMNRIQEGFETYCGRVFDEGTFTEQYDGNNFISAIQVKNPPIQSITSLHDDPALSFPDSTKYAATEYTFYSDTGIVALLNKYVFQTGRRNIKVIYKGAYNDSTSGYEMPKDIRQALIEEVARRYKRADVIMNRTIAAQGSNVQLVETEFLPSTEAVLKRYIKNIF